MALNVPQGGPSEYAKIPPPKVGAHHAVCAEVFDRGLVKTENGDQRKIWLVFQVQELIQDSGTDLDGKRKEVRISANLRKLNPRTKLRQILESWRGEELTDDDFDENGNFDLEKVVGVPATVVVGSWSDPDENGRRYPNDCNVLPPDDPSVQLVGNNEMEVLDYVTIDERKKQSTDFPPKDGSAPAPSGSSKSSSGGKAKRPAPF